MSTKNIIIWVIVGIIVLGGVYVLSPKTFSPVVKVGEPEVMDQIASSTIKNYSSPEYGLSFQYPDGYILLEHEVGSPESPQKAIVIVEDNKSNRDILEGKVPEVGEGPTNITIDIFQNTKKLSVEDWVTEKASWILQNEKKEPITISGKPGFTYFWDRLFAGKSSIVTENNRTYIFSVTWITPEDKMLKDFQKILDSVKF